MLYGRNPFVEQRRLHLLRLRDFIEKRKKAMKGKFDKEDKAQLVAMFCIMTGLKKDTVLRMYDEIMEAGILEDGR